MSDLRAADRSTKAAAHRFGVRQRTSDTATGNLITFGDDCCAVLIIVKYRSTGPEGCLYHRGERLPSPAVSPKWSGYGPAFGSWPRDCAMPGSARNRRLVTGWVTAAATAVLTVCGAGPALAAPVSGGTAQARLTAAPPPAS